MAGYLLVAALLSTLMLVTHFSDALALQRQLSPGAAGLPVALLGAAAVPNAVLAAVGYLTGPGFTVGSHTSVSVVAVNHGQLPTFPLLGAVPAGRPATVLGLLMMLGLALLAGWLVLRVIAKHDSWLPRLLDATVAAVLAGALLAVLSALGSGSVGSGALRGIGEQWWAVGACASLAVLFGAAVSLAVEVVRARPVQLPVENPIQRLHAISGDRVDEPAEAKPVEASANPAEAPDRSRNVS
ncbi:MAG: DUF6350 family protein [Jatrophihabitantaceae bacterium]